MPRRKPKEPPSSKNFRVSQSKVKTWRKCHRAYHLKYVEELKAKKKARALNFGTMVHKSIEAHLEGDDPMEYFDDIDVNAMPLFAAEKAEYRETLADARLIMAEYFDYWEEMGDFRPVRIKGRSSEHSFEIELLPDVIFNGKIDALARHNRLRWLVEHKTFKRRPSDDDRWRNLQSVTYFRAIDILGFPPVDGTCWDYIWSNPPRIPGLLKGGKMSQKNIDTLPSAVIAAVKQHGLEPLDYKKFIDAAHVHRSKWFSRVFTPVNKQVRDYVFNDFISTVKDMVEGHGKKQDMNIERHCSWCEFEPLCRARMQGLDEDYVKERHYEKSDYKAGPAIHVHSYEEDDE